MGCSWYRAWRRDGWKYIHATTPELYHVSEDPREQHDLAAAEPDRVALMRAELRKLLAEARPIAVTASRSLSPNDRRALESLGYVSSVAHDDEFESELDLFEPTGPDPKDYIEQSHQKARAVETMFAGDYSRAEQILRTLLDQSGPEQSAWWAHKTLAEVLRAQGKPDAFDHYRKALEIRPDDGETRGNLAYALADAGRLDDAIKACERALESPPIFASTHHTYGRALASKGRLQQALTQQRAAIKLDPEYAQAYAEMGDLLARLGRAPEAIHAYELALDRAPQDAQIRGRFAELLLAQRRPNEALQHFKQLVQLTPESARAHGGLGIAYNALGQPNEAIESLRAATALDPELRQAWQALGEVLVARRRYKEAIAAYRSGFEAAPQDAAITHALARLLATCPDDTSRDGAEALRLARELEQATASRDATVLDTLAAALAEVGRFAEAVQVIDRALAVAGAGGHSEMAEQLRHRRELYKANTPYRLPSTP
jgi:tetratricopeptide (TPR) repeat protein